MTATSNDAVDRALPPLSAEPTNSAPLTRASRASRSWCASTSAATRFDACTWIGAASFSGTPSSLRSARTVTTISCRVSIASTLTASAGKSPGCGKRVSAMLFDGAATPTCACSACQSSSVRKGMKGDSNRSAASNTLTNAPNVSAVSGVLSPSKTNRSLTSSRYQSQNSPQKNWYTACAASSNRYVASERSTAAVTA